MPPEPGTGTEVIEAGQFLGNDGVLQEDWMDHAFKAEEDAELKTNPTLANIKTVQGLAKQVISGESTIGKLSGGRAFAILPNENSDDAERNAFHTKLGRPEKAEGYEFGKLQLPDGVPKNDAIATKMAQSLFSLGASKAMAQGVFQDYTQMLAEIKKSDDISDKQANMEVDKELRTTVFGAAYDAKFKLINHAIESMARPISEDFANTLKAELPYDSPAAQFFAKVGEMISEDSGLLGGGAPIAGQLTPGDAAAKRAELTADPYYMTPAPKDKPRNQEKHDQLVQEVKRLIEIEVDLRKK